MKQLLIDVETAQKKSIEERGQQAGPTTVVVDSTARFKEVAEKTAKNRNDAIASLSAHWWKSPTK
jgi:hypothetical protein